jgi:hypothetical protein
MRKAFLILSSYFLKIGNCGINIDLSRPVHTCNTINNTFNDDVIGKLFSEELGIVLEVLPQNIQRIQQLFRSKNINSEIIGQTTIDKNINIKVDNKIILDCKTAILRDIWESTSFALERYIYIYIYMYIYIYIYI